MISNNRLYTELKFACKLAGENALRKQKNVPAECKGAKDTVTAVDRENGESIRNRLLRIAPKLSFLDEEHGTSGS